jgi:uncharacterized protein (DUF1330 family)
VAAYVIADNEVLDMAKFQEYARAVPATAEKYGGRFLARGGTAHLLEGDLQPHRVVIIEFPSVQQAQAWWSSPEYEAIKPLRHAAAKCYANILVEGVQQ